MTQKMASKGKVHSLMDELMGLTSGRQRTVLMVLSWPPAEFGARLEHYGHLGGGNLPAGAAPEPARAGGLQRAAAAGEGWREEPRELGAIDSD